MKTTILIKLSALLAIFFGAISMTAQNQPYLPNGEIDTLKLAEGRFLFRSNSKTGNPNAVSFIGKDGIFLVDSSFAAFGNKLSAKLKELGGTNVKFVVDTHWHGDHTGGNENFGSSAVISARANVRKRLSNQNILDDGGRLLAVSGLPILAYKEKLTLYFNDEEIQIISLPQGHNDGDTIVYFTKSKVLCVGDYLFLNRFPVIDVEESNADLQGYLRNLKFIIGNFPSDVKIAPGHSDFYLKELRSTIMQNLKAYHSMISENIEFARRQIASGKSLEKIQKDGFPEKYRLMDERPRFVSQTKWIETYKSLSAEKK